MGLLSVLFGKTDNIELSQIIRDGAFLVDVRSPSEFASGSVKSAVNIPLDRVKNQLTKFKDKKNIVVFCLSGGRSAQAKKILEQNGFQNVIDGKTWRIVKQATES